MVVTEVIRLAGVPNLTSQKFNFLPEFSSLLCVLLSSVSPYSLLDYLLLLTIYLTFPLKSLNYVTLSLKLIDEPKMLGRVVKVVE